jgi:hypothetical protein
VKTLSDILYHGGNSPVARMAAGLQLKNTLTSKDPTIKTQYQQRWLSFADETRAYVKKNVRLFYITIRILNFLLQLIIIGILYLDNSVNLCVILVLEWFVL